MTKYDSGGRLCDHKSQQPPYGAEAGSGPSACAAVRDPEISKLHMESMERHRDVNRHPEIKSNQLEVASWHSS